MFKIEFYTLPNGRKPVEEFLDSLECKIKIKAIDSLAILEEFGNKLREPYSKQVDKGLYELRIRFSSDISRIFYFFYEGNKIILTNGFVKKSNKTPARELELAKKYRADYKRRKSNE